MNDKNKFLAGSAAALAIICGGLTALEGNRPKTYDDIAGVATACIGHTGPDVVTGKTYTKAECMKFLDTDLAEHTQAVLKCTNVALSEKTYAALVIFTFNVGATAYCSSSLLKRLNAGDYVGACNGLMAWNKARVNGTLTEIKGLTNRRNFERKLCLEGL